MRSLSWLLILLLALGLVAGPLAPDLRPAVAEDEESDEEPIDRDREGARELLDEGDVKREEQLWSEAANLYWKAVEADLLEFVAHVRYQETGIKAGDDLDEMKGDYDSFIEDYPSQLCFKLHRLRLDDATERLEALNGLVAKHGKSADLHLEIARANLALGNGKAAMDAMTKAMPLKIGKRPDMALMMAEAEWAAGKQKDALKRLDAAVKADGEDFVSRLTLARFQLLDGAYEDSARNAEVVVQQRPTYMAAFLVRAEALAGADDLDEAVKVLQAAYRANKDAPDVILALADLWARLNAGKVIKREGSKENPYLKEALKLYDQALEQDEENWRALYGKAWVLERQGDYEAAEELYREVSAILPESVMAVNSIGYCLFKQGRVTESQVQFKRALDMDPEFVTALANLGSTYDAQAKYKEAIQLYEKILKDKRYKDYLRAIINCAFDYEALGSFPKALKLLMRAHELLPEDANVVVWIGDNHYFSKKWKDAEKWYQKGVEMDEKSFFGWRGLGLTFGQRKRWADAVNALENASKLKPDDIDMYVILGDIYYMELKDLEKALKQYQEYIQRGGTDPEVQDAVTEIKKELAK